MAVNQNDGFIQTTTVGGETTIDFDFEIETAADLRVLLTSPSNVITTLVNGTHYSVPSVSLNDPAGGVINISATAYPSGLPAGYKVTCLSDYDEKRSSDFQQGGDFFAGTLNQQLDRLTVLTQQLRRDVDRSASLPQDSVISSLTLPAPEAGKAIVWNTGEDGLENSSDYIADAIADATAGVTGTSLITATSTTSLTVTGTGSKTWTVQSGRGFALGQRLRASSDDGTKINEGIVTDYTGTSLTINIDYVSGSGTHADWNIGVAGDRGAAGAGTGDLLAANNLADLASTATAFNTIKQAASTTNTGVIEIATDAEALAGSATDKAIVPSNFLKDLSSNGYVKLPGGLIIQWGAMTPTSYTEGTTNTITYPTSFSTACFGVYLQMRSTTNIGSNSNAVPYLKSAPGLSSAEWAFDPVSATYSSGTMYWFAMGY